MPSTFLHELPESALQNLLRFLSSKPSGPNWVSFVNLEDALAAVYPASPLREDARTLFNRLSANLPRFDDEEAVLHLPDGSDASLLTRWLQSADEFLTELTRNESLVRVFP